jgi:hypothetical protein
MTIEASNPLADKALQIAGAVAAALALVLMASGPGFSQPSETRERAARQGQGTAQPRPPAAVPGAAASAHASARAPQTKTESIKPESIKPESTKPWSIEDALPDNSPAARERIKETPAPAKPALGRVPLQNSPGTFGLETETKMKSTEFPDGRRAPGVETTTHRPPSYFGLSISVPTNDKSIIPPIPAPFGKSD